MLCRILQVVLIAVLAAGCAHRTSRDGVISQELPLTVDDLSEIKDGKKNHEKVLWEYREYKSPKLEKYCNAIAASIAEVSERPHLPYQVILLDSDEVNVFGGPGGYIYITRGFFDFIDSEGELAGAIAHEIVHVANYEYSSIPHLSKIQKAYNLALSGSEFAKSSIGTYGTAANVGLKGIGKAAPAIAKRFGHDDEVETDEKAIEVLVKAGYDPRGYLKFVEKLSRIGVDDIEKFSVFMSTHPPFADRRVLLNNKIGRMALDSGKIAFKKDMMLTETRQETVNKPDTIVFSPRFESSHSPYEMPQSKKQEVTPYRDKSTGWF